MDRYLRYLPAILIFALVIAGMEIDVSIPCFPDMASHFGASEETIQWTLTINFLGFCISTLIIGPLSDSFGRRRIILGGGLFFLAGALGCSLANDISSLIAYRFFQGLGASAFWTVGLAIVSDVYKGDKAVHFMGLMNACVTAAMSIAPSLGGLLNETLGWRSTYSFIAIGTTLGYLLLYFTLPETNKTPSKWSWKQLISNYVTLCKSSNFLAYAIFPNLIALAYFAFVSISPFLYITVLKVPTMEYTFHQGSVIGTFSVISFFSGRIGARFGERRCVITGAITAFAATVGLCIAAVLFPVPPLLITLLADIYALSVGLAFGVVFAKSLEIFPNMSGAATAFMMSTRTLCCALGIWVTGNFYNGTLTSVAIVMFICMGGCVALLFPMYYKKAQQTA